MSPTIKRAALSGTARNSAWCVPPLETSQKYTRRVAHPVGDHRALPQFEVEAGLDQLLRHLKELLGQGHQFIRRQTAMTFVHRLGQRIGNSRTNPGGFLNAEIHGDCVGSLEPDATDIAGEPLGIFRHHLDGIGTVGLEDPHCPCATDAVAMQEDP